jgi:hypothetical protein
MTVPLRPAPAVSGSSSNGCGPSASAGSSGREAKSRYKFPYGDFVNVHRCAVLAAESRAGQRKYTDVELAAAHLHGMLEG